MNSKNHTDFSRSVGQSARTVLVRKSDVKTTKHTNYKQYLVLGIRSGFLTQFQVEK